MGFGYNLLAMRRALAYHRIPALRDQAYWFTFLFLVLDPLNLSLGPFIYGGDARGIAVGLGGSTAAVQGISFVLLLLNRELVAQARLPALGVVATQPLFKPLIPIRRPSRAAYQPDGSDAPTCWIWTVVLPASGS